MPQSLMFIVSLITKATMIDFHEINPIWCACVCMCTFVKKKNPIHQFIVGFEGQYDNALQMQLNICNSRLLKFHACFL